MSVDKKMLVLIVMFAIAGGWIQSLASNGDHIQQVHEIILMICVCLAIMAVIIFWDYTVIGKYPIVLWVILCLLPSAAVVTARSLSLGDITGNNFGRFVVSGLLLPAYSAIVYHYRNKGYWGITCCMTILPFGDIFLPFCYPGWAVNGACYVMARIYLSVYRNTDLAAE